MAIKPIDIRLDELNQANADIDQRADLASTAPSVEQAQPDFPEEGVQVAGLGSGLKGALKFGKKVAEQVAEVEIRKAPTLTKKAQDAADIQDLQKATELTGTATPMEAAVTGKVEVSKDPNMTPEAVVAERQAQIDKRAGVDKAAEVPPKTAFNLPLMDSEESVKSTVEAINQMAGIKTAKITFDDVVKKAEESGIGIKFINDLVKNKLAVNPENTYKVLNAMTESAKKLNGLAEKVATGKASPEEAAEFAQTIHFHSVLQQSAKGYQTNVAQSLAVMRIPRGGMDDIGEILQSVGGDSNITRFAQAFIELKDPMARAEMIRKSAQGNVWEKLYTVYVNGLLSRPTTHIKNALSNTVFIPWRMTERVAATGIGALRRAAGFGSTDAYRFAEIPAMLISTPVALKNGFALAAHAWKTGVPKGWKDPAKIARQQSRMELFNYKADGSLLSAGIKALNYATTLPGRSLMTADEWFKGINYTQELAAEATRLQINTFEEAIKAGKTTEEAMTAGDSAIADFLAEPPDYVAQLAEKGTFTQKLEGLGGELQKSAQANTAIGFAVRTQIPFISTPLNIMAETISRTPLGTLSKGLVTDILKGGTKESDMAMAKVGLGSAAMYGFSTMATNGSLTGSGPGDRGTRDAMTRQGWQPYSFVVNFSNIDDDVKQAMSKIPTSVRYGTGDYKGKVFISYQGLEPVGALMAMSADYVDYAKYEGDNSRINEIAGGLAFGFANYMMESPFLQGVSNVQQIFGEIFAASNDKGRFINGIDNVAKTFAEVSSKSVMPLSGALTSIKEKIDPLQRDYQADPNLPAGLKGLMDGFNKIRGNLPGLSESLPPKLNIWGEPSSYEYAYAPWRMKEGKQRPVDQAMIQLNANVGMPSREVSAKDPATGISTSTKLTTEEYNEVLRIANEELGLEDSAMTVIEAIELDAGNGDLIRYQQAVKKVFTNTFTVAKETLLGDSKYSDAIQKRISDRAEQLKQFGQGAR
jgi:hypothetical protein